MGFDFPGFRALLLPLLLGYCCHADGLKKFPSIHKHRAYFLNQLSRDMYPVWFPNRLPLENRDDYAGNQISLTIRSGITTGKPLPSNYTPYYILSHLLRVTKYNKIQGKPLIRDPEMLDLLFDGLKLKDDKIRFRVLEAITEFLHPDLKLKKRKEILKGLAIKPGNFEEMVKRKIPLLESEKDSILNKPKGYSEYVRFLAGDEQLREEIETELINAKDFRTFAHAAGLLVDADPDYGAPILFKEINDPIYDSKDTGSSVKHVRTIVISLLGGIYPDNRLLNDDYELYIQQGQVYETPLQKRKVSSKDVRKYLESVIQWGKVKFGTEPRFPLESNPVIERLDYPKEVMGPQAGNASKGIDSNKVFEAVKDVSRDTLRGMDFGKGMKRIRVFKMEQKK